MAGVEVENKIYEMPPREGITIAHFLIVADIRRSMEFYERVSGARLTCKLYSSWRELHLIFRLVY